MPLDERRWGARELKKKTKETKVGHFVFFLLLKMLHII
jgi:hypothetical protein